MNSRVGFIGLGIMGRPMAINLLQGGYSLWVYSRRALSMEPLLEKGAKPCRSPAETAGLTDIIFTMVSDTKDVEEVILGEEGIIHGAKRGAIVVDMSTISPVTTGLIAQKLAERGIEMLDAPVSGGEMGAINGTLSIMVGGKPDVFSRVKPLFDCLGKNIVHVGKNGAGQAAKACNQIAVTLTMIGVAEAFIFARKNNVDPVKVREALLGGFAYSKILEFHGNRMLKGDFIPGFKAHLHQKDLRIVIETAHQLGVALPGTALGSQLVNALVGAGGGEMDCSAISRVIEKLNA